MEVTVGWPFGPISHSLNLFLRFARSLSDIRRHQRISQSLRDIPSHAIGQDHRLIDMGLGTGVSFFAHLRNDGFVV